MGKSLDDLNLSDEPLRSVDLRDETWYQFCQEIDDLILSDDFYWAINTLEGIRESVEQYKVVTEGQRRAIANIRDARQERRRGWGRRYEGFGR